MDALIAKINSLDASLEEMKGKVEEQQTKITTQETKITEQENKINEQNTKIANQDNKINEQNTKITNLQNSIKTLDSIYPVGSIYITTQLSTAAQVAQRLGGGTWQQYGAGRTLIGAGTGTDINSLRQSFAVNATGGEYKHTLTTTEMPSHTHNFSTLGSALVVGSGTNHPAMPNNLGFDTINSAGWWSGVTKNNSTIAATGGSGAHNNLQPYIVVYMWRRTA